MIIPTFFDEQYVLNCNLKVKYKLWAFLCRRDWREREGSSEGFLSRYNQDRRVRLSQVERHRYSSTSIRRNTALPMERFQAFLRECLSLPLFLLFQKVRTLDNQSVFRGERGGT